MANAVIKCVSTTASQQGVSVLLWSCLVIRPTAANQRPPPPHSCVLGSYRKKALFPVACYLSHCGLDFSFTPFSTFRNQPCLNCVESQLMETEASLLPLNIHLIILQGGIAEPCCTNAVVPLK